MSVMGKWVSGISYMGDSCISVMKDWGSFGSEVLSGGSGNSWGISWDYGSVSISGEGSNRGDWSSSENMDSWVRISFTLSNVMSIRVSSITIASISYMTDKGVMEDWGSLSGKVLSGGSGNSWGISWDNSSISISGKSTDRGNWGSSE